MNTVTTSGAHARRDATPEDTRRLLMIGAGLLAGIMLAIAAYSHWWSNQTSTRQEVHTAMSRLDPACREVARLRIRSQLIRGGRPLTRAQVDDMTSGIEHCDDINQQMAGAEDPA